MSIGGELILVGVTIFWLWFSGYTDHKNLRINFPENFKGKPAESQRWIKPEIDPAKNLGERFIKVSGWVNFLCGKPWSDNFLALSGIFKQTSALILAVLFALLTLLGLPSAVRIFIFFVFFLLITMTYFIVFMFFKPKGWDDSNGG